jgi:hypothetical protein
VRLETHLQATISVLSKSSYGRSLDRGKAVIWRMLVQGGSNAKVFGG